MRSQPGRFTERSADAREPIVGQVDECKIACGGKTAGRGRFPRFSTFVSFCETGRKLQVKSPKSNAGIYDPRPDSSTRAARPTTTPDNDDPRKCNFKSIYKKYLQTNWVRLADLQHEHPRPWSTDELASITPAILEKDDLQPPVFKNVTAKLGSFGKIAC